MATPLRIAASPAFSRFIVPALLMLTACAANVTYKGLRPVYPVYPDSYSWHYGSPYDNVVMDVDSLQPTLEWESFPRQRYLTATNGVTLDRIRNITYELKISNSASELVYERTGLTSPQHRVEIPLQPATRYLWSVRAHFDLDGHPKVTGWGEMTVDIQAKGLVPRNLPYSFKTPEDK